MKAPTARTDPELVRQLEAAADTEEPVEAVFMFHPDHPSEAAPSPERTEELTHKVLERIKNRTGSRERRFKVFRNIGSFVVSAHPSFIREVLSEPEIAAGVANQQSGPAMVKPVGKSTVNPTERSKSAKDDKKKGAEASRSGNKQSKQRTAGSKKARSKRK